MRAPRSILVDVVGPWLTVPHVTRSVVKSPLALVLVLATTLLGLGAWALAAAAPSSAETDRNADLNSVTLVSSWPEQNFTMWLPPQQGWLEFSGPVRTSTMVLELTRPEQPNVPVGEVTRLTRGESEKRVSMRFSDLSPGPYELTFSVEPSKGDTTVTGTVSFTLGPEFTAPGGGNHRHDGSHIEYDTPWTLFLRVLLVFAASLLLFSWYRGRQAARSLFDVALPRVGAALMAVYAASAGATAVLVAVYRYPDTPLEAVLSSAALWVFFPLFVVSAILVISGRRDSLAVIVALASLALSGFAFQHGDQVWLVFATIFASLLLVSASVSWASLWASLAEAPHVRRQTLVTLSLATVASCVLSGAMLVAHARGFSFVGDFAFDAAMRLVAALSALSGVALMWLTVRVRVPVLRWALSALPVLLIVAGSSALLWLPPPASGL